MRKIAVKIDESDPKLDASFNRFCRYFTSQKRHGKKSTATGPCRKSA